jgi:hypothetical protein
MISVTKLGWLHLFRDYIIPLSSCKSGIKTLHNQSFQVNGPRLFTKVPRNIMDTQKVATNEFKEK